MYIDIKVVRVFSFSITQKLTCKVVKMAKLRNVIIIMLIVTIIMGFESNIIHGGNSQSKPSKGFESEMIHGGDDLSKPLENSEHSSQHPEPVLSHDQPPVHKAHAAPVDI